MALLDKLGGPQARLAIHVEVHILAISFLVSVRGFHWPA
jgi:hypothetical protein